MLSGMYQRCVCTKICLWKCLKDLGFVTTI